MDNSDVPNFKNLKRMKIAKIKPDSCHELKSFYTLFDTVSVYWVKLFQVIVWSRSKQSRNCKTIRSGVLNFGSVLPFVIHYLVPRFIVDF